MSKEQLTEMYYKLISKNRFALAESYAKMINKPLWVQGSRGWHSMTRPTK